MNPAKRTTAAAAACLAATASLTAVADVNTVTVRQGSGDFALQEGIAQPDRPIRVYYHKPASFDEHSPILLVLPGAGRNAWDYRDAWIEASETHGVLILSPSYPEELYDFAGYHMGGVIQDLELENMEVDTESGSTRYRIADEDIRFTRRHNPEQWIFGDFDLIFRRAVEATDSARNSYDLFGHSAGGQILHRLAIFSPALKVDRIVAANSGSYTLPTHDVPMPFGLGGTQLSEQDLRLAFAAKLTLLLGANDNVHETRGSMLHTPTADRQGLGRYSRGRFFYRKSKEAARLLDTGFNWRLEVVEDVGHDFRRMSQAAADFLYAAPDES